MTHIDRQLIVVFTLIGISCVVVQGCVSENTATEAGVETSPPDREVPNEEWSDTERCDSSVVDFQTDPTNCGGCGIVCESDSAGFGVCADGTCTIEACLGGFSDLDADPSNGCEATCGEAASNDPCDGLDNDCDGVIDEDFLPQSCGVGICSGMSACTAAGEVLQCQPSEAPLTMESVCDGLDNDCDGVVDEALATTCLNQCGTGSAMCARGTFSNCVAVSESGETCVDLDVLCEPTEVELTFPLPRVGEDIAADILWVLDATNPCVPLIRSFKDHVEDITDKFFAVGAGVRVGIATYGADDCRDNRRPYELIQPLDSDEDGFLESLNSVNNASYGRTVLFEAVYQALTGEGVSIHEPECPTAEILPSEPGWDRDVFRHVIVTAGHQPSFYGGSDYSHAANDAIAAAIETETKVSVLWYGNHSVPAAVTRMANLSGGYVYQAEDGRDGVIEVIEEAINATTLNTQIDITIDGDEYGFVTDVSPRNLTGIDLRSNQSLDMRISILSPFTPTDVDQTFDFDVVFSANGRETARHPVSITIPAGEAKHCTNRPPIISSMTVPSSLQAGESTLLEAVTRTFDGEYTQLEWSASDGVVLESGGTSTLYTAPAEPGLVEIDLDASDAAGGVDRETRVLQVLGGQCLAPAERMVVGAIPGGVSLLGSLSEAQFVDGSCGATGTETTILLDVSTSGTYRIEAETEEIGFHIRSRDCNTELYCQLAHTGEVQLDQGVYYLFAEDSRPEAGQFIVTVTPVQD